MKYLIYAFTILLAFAVNVGIFAQFQLFGVAPNILLLLTVAFCLDKNDDSDFLFVAFLAGLFLDFYSGLLVGSFTLGLLLIAVLINALIKKIVVYEINWKYLAVLGVLTTVALQLFLWFYSLIVARLGWFPYYLSFKMLARLLLPEILYNSILIYPIYALVGSIKRWLGRRESLRHKV